MKKLTLSQCIEGFLLHAAAQQLSQHTIADYSTTFRRFQAFLSGDPPLAAIKRDQVEAFLAFLATPQPGGGAVKRQPKPLSKKTVLNYHTGLSALWSWALDEGIVEEHVLRRVERPRPEQPAIVPLSEADVKALLAVCDRSRTYSRPGKRASDHARGTALRDKAIIVLLLDTGMRASELCGLRMRDIDIKNWRIYVFGKGSKERMLPVCAQTAKALWKYINTDRADVQRLDDPVFVTDDGGPFLRTALLTLLARLGEKAGVKDCHPHRFRHTFAINFLRNGGNAYELQMALGHSTLEMVRTYLALAQTDLDQAHRTASPVSKWRLLERDR